MKLVLFVTRTLDFGAVIAAFVSGLSAVPRPCARWTDLFHPNLKDVNAVFIPPQPIPLPLGPLRRAGGGPSFALAFETHGTHPHHQPMNTDDTHTLPRGPLGRGWSVSHRPVPGGGGGVCLPNGLGCTTACQPPLKTSLNQWTL